MYYFNSYYKKQLLSLILLQLREIFFRKYSYIKDIYLEQTTKLYI